MAVTTYSTTIERNLDLTVECGLCGSTQLLTQRLYFEGEASASGGLMDLMGSHGRAQKRAVSGATAAATELTRLADHRVWSRCHSCGRFDGSSMQELREAIPTFQRRTLLQFLTFSAFSLVIIVITILGRGTLLMFASALLLGTIPIAWMQRPRDRRAVEARLAQANEPVVVETWRSGPAGEIASLAADIAAEPDLPKRRKLVNELMEALHGADPIPVGHFYRRFGIKTDWELRTSSWRSSGYGRQPEPRS